MRKRICRSAFKLLCSVLCCALCLLLCSCSFSVEDAMKRLKAYINGTEVEAPPEGFVESRETKLYTYDVYEDHVVLTGYLGEALSVSVPRTLDGLPVTKIGELAFYYGAAVETVVVPDTVTELADNAFYYCRALTRIILPTSITDIGEKCFSWCSSLTSITLPQSVTVIPDFCFNECTALETIILPEGLTSVGTRAFSGCKALTALSFGDGVTSVGSLAFRDCAALTNLRFPGSCTVGENAFSGCTAGLTVATKRNSPCWRSCREQEVTLTEDIGASTLPEESSGTSEESLTIEE